MGVSDIVYLPSDFQSFWSQIPPEGELPIERLNEIIRWLKDNGNIGDYVLVQGEFGAVFYIVDFCFQYGLVPIYSTTKRIVLKEEDSNSKVVKTNVFEHVAFRKYLRYNIV